MNFALDENGDLKVENNRLRMTSGRDAIIQHLKCRIRFFLGEWFLNKNYGVPWFRDILVKSPSFALVQDDLKTVILDTPGILSLTYFELDYAGERLLELSFTAQSTDGPISYSQTVGV